MDTVHPIALITEIAHAIRRFLEAGLTRHGLTFNQYNLLQLLSQREVWLPSELADRLSINRPTTTVILRNLESKGWISRRTDPVNRRNVRVRITDSGRQTAEAARRWMLRVKGSFDPLVGLSREEQAALITSLQTIRTSVSEHLAQLAERLAHEEEN